MGALKLVFLALFPAVVLGDTYQNPVNEAGNKVQARDAYRIVAGSNLQFANTLYEVLSRQEGNVFFSPLSIHVVMALATQGAGGKTLQEMITGLSLPQDQQITRNGFRQLLKVFKTNEEETVKLANKIYLDRKYPPTPEFVRIALEMFHSDAEKVDFQRDYDHVRQNINQWVEENTANKIQNMLPQGSIGSDTAMILLNAVYFKSTWSVQFDPQNTKRKTFYIRQGEEREINMMHVKEGEKFNYREAPELKARILEMPYVGNSMSFVIILPDEKYGLQNVEASLARSDLRELFKQMRNPEVHVTMPRFKFEHSVELNAPLKQLGMREMFTSYANFTGLTTGPQVKVSKVVHKAFIDVNEEGAEAAATTVVKLTKRRGSPPSVDFEVDRPFLFLVCHTLTLGDDADVRDQEKSVLFMGRFWEPLG